MEQTAAPSGQGSDTNVPNNLAVLVPTFDPATDNVEIWGKKVELLLSAWPPSKISELSTRLILGCKGTAFQKLQLESAQLLSNDVKCIKRIVELVGGTWGQIPLERRFEIVERALFRNVQKADENSDSYLSRSDVTWTELANKNIQLEEVRSYVLLRGSRLSGEDKKRVLIESGAETGAALDIKKVTAAIRMLGSEFFHDMTGLKREKGLKTYDHHTFNTEEVSDTEADTYWMADESMLDDQTLEVLASEDDEDATLVLQFEDAVSELVQNDQELGALFSTYQDARKRLSEKVRFRGFWSVKKGDRSSKGFKGKGKGKMARQSLASRIASSYCRLYNKKGHWKNECPMRSSMSSTGPSSSSAPTTFVTVENAQDFNLPFAEDSEGDNIMLSFANVTTAVKAPTNFQKAKVRLMNTLRKLNIPHTPVRTVPSSESLRPCQVQENTLCEVQESLFASEGTHGVVDLGASQTVIGSSQVPDLLKLIPKSVRDVVKQVPCHLTFRFGNHQTLVSKYALLMPLGSVSFRIAVVPGNTPFLLSNSFLKGIQAVIDTDSETLWSKKLQRNLVITRTHKNLFLMDINQLWEDTPSDELGDSCFASESVKIPKSGVGEGSEVAREVSGSKTLTRESDTASTIHQEPSEDPLSVAQSQTQSALKIDRDRVLCQHVSESEVDRVPQGRCQSNSCRENYGHQEPRFGDLGAGENLFREGTRGRDISGGIRGSCLDGLVRQDLRMEWQGSPREVHHLCREEVGQGDQSRVSQSRCQEVSSQAQSQVVSPELKCVGALMEPCETGFHRDGLRDRDGAESSAHVGHGRASTAGVPKERNNEPKDHGHRDGDSRADQSREEFGSEGRTIGCALEESTEDRHDFVFIAPSSETMSYKQKIDRLVTQMMKEMEIVENSIPEGRSRRMDLFEVMCHDQSELTHQAEACGMNARRFDKETADLSTKEGRFRLFRDVCVHKPKHLWFSPECGPWSKWSSLNISKSLTLEEKVLSDRESKLWQIALGIVLHRYQRQYGNHFHMEQPAGSMMWHIPGSQELTENMHPCCFDLCRVGSLRDPETQEAIRKRLLVFTTSTALQVCLHGKWCLGNHQHRPIAGSTKVDGQTVPVSKFTEWYPKRFVKQIIKAFKQETCKSECLVNESEEHPTKRRRLGKKLSPQEIEQHFPNVNWQTVMTLADRLAPRVGKLIVDNGELLRAVQQMCPNQDVKHLVLCRGMNRSLGPCRAIPKGSAPLRRFISLVRKTNTLNIEEEWEPWERLSLRALGRACTPSRIGVTIFAAPKHSVPTTREQETPSADVPIPEQAPEDLSEQPWKKPRVESSEAEQEHREDHNHQTDESLRDHQKIDLASHKHGPKFLELKSEEQAWMLKLHRNLGHPGSAKLQEFCRQLNCPDRILQAIPDIQCSACVENRNPRVARTAAIHEATDFGEVMSMDGVTWTNKAGERFHFYHFVDQATSYQTAIVSPSRNTTQAFQALMKGWFIWAGAPKLLILDAATELNSEEFMRHLQKHNVCSRTCATDAHWQNARAERHGGILQVMLNKMDSEVEIRSYEDLEEALQFATQTKNQWSRHRGYPPEMLVFGKCASIPGSTISDLNRSSHAIALQNLPDGIRFREELAIRERARRAFALVDNSQVLRRAIVSRSRPNRGPFEKGEWVMIWKKRGEAEGQWSGPMQVLAQEGKSVVWVTMGQKLYRVAPEHVRYLSAVEEWKNPINNQDIGNRSVMPPHGGTQFHNLVPEHDHLSQGNETQGGNNEGPIAQEHPHVNSDGHNHGQTPNSPTVEQSEQPDGEPEIQSVPSSQPLAPISDEENNETPNPGEGPENIPIPSDDDELFCEVFDPEAECYHLQEDVGWQFEVDIAPQDIERWRSEEQPHQMAFLASAAKRQRSEVKMHQLTEEEKKMFRQAKDKEIQSWLSTETVCRILRSQVPQENIMRCRWILTWKPTDSEGDQKEKMTPKLTPKARLVVLGYEDPLVHEIPRDSPTMSKLARMLILQYAASQQWDIESFDIKTAFLRGEEHSDRILGLEPPMELRDKLKLAPQEILKLLKGAYGRVDAPYLWYMELKKGLEELKFIPSPFDPCTFVLPHPKTGQTEGLIGIHVDDGLCCGSAYFHQQLKRLESKFPFGSQKKRNFTFTGLRIDQQRDYSIWVNQQQYINDIAAITVPRDRRLTLESPVTEKERQSLRAVIGSLQYAAVNSGPDICSRLGALQSAINRASVGTLLEANKVLHEAKRFSGVTIKIQPIPLEHLRFIAFSDASFASAKSLDSHQGMMIMSCHKDISNNRTSVVNPLIWHSKKIQKVAVSTLSAEAMSLAGAVDMLSWVRLFWGWLQNVDIPWKHADETLLKLPEAFAAIPPQESREENNAPSDKVSELLKKLPKENSSIITTDCKSLYDLISRTAPPSCQEFRTQLQAKLIKEHLKSGVQIRWVPSQAQIADSLTKIMENAMLRECLSIGKYCLHDETEMLKQRSDAKTRLRWLRENAKHGGDEV